MTKEPKRSHLLNLGEPGSQQGGLLFGHRHVELLILKTAFTEEVIAQALVRLRR